MQLLCVGRDRYQTNENKKASEFQANLNTFSTVFTPHPFCHRSHPSSCQNTASNWTPLDPNVIPLVWKRARKSMWKVTITRFGMSMTTLVLIIAITTMNESNRWSNGPQPKRVRLSLRECQSSNSNERERDESVCSDSFA